MSTAWVPSLEICLIGVACKKCMIQNIYLYSTEADDASLCRWWGRALNGCCLFKNVCVAQSLGAACRRRGFFHEFVMKCWLTNRKIKKNHEYWKHFTLWVDTLNMLGLKAYSCLCVHIIGTYHAFCRDRKSLSATWRPHKHTLHREDAAVHMV